MLNGYRLATIAFGLALASAAALAQEGQQPAVESQPVPTVGEERGDSAREQNPTPESDSAGKLLPAIQGIESAIRNLIAEEDKVASEREEDREVADLKAQIDMARWAFWMLIATGATVILTAVGVVLIARTLLYTREAAVHAGRAVDEAKHATKAARDAVDVTRNMGEAQIRAYLYCKSAKYELRKDHVSAIIEIANSGQSPASDVTVTGTAGINDVGGWPTMPRVLSYVHSTEADGNSPPIVSNSTGLADLTFFWDHHFEFEDEEDRAHGLDVFKSGNELYFDITITWRDVFRNRHEMPLSLNATIDASPYAPRKKRTPNGKLNVVMNDTRHGVLDKPRGEAEDQ